MKVYDETYLRANQISSQKVFEILKEDYLTPSAKEYLKKHKIKVVFKKADKNSMPFSSNTNGDKLYTDHLTGQRFPIKPDDMTHLHENELVSKTHPRIKFRGKLDSLQALVLKCQIEADKQGLNKFVDDLADVLEFLRRMLGCEVKGEPFSLDSLIGYTNAQLREVSHDIKGNFGINHITPNYQMGEVVIELNMLRTAVRETELLCAKTFGKERLDFINALNRLSSAIYILEIKTITKGF